MTNNDDTQDQTPEEVTMVALWRHISGMEARLSKRFDASDAKIDAVRDELKEESQALRQVVDTLSSQEDFASLDRKISSVSADTQATRQATQDVKAEVSRLRSDVKAAGITVR